MSKSEMMVPGWLENNTGWGHPAGGPSKKPWPMSWGPGLGNAGKQNKMPEHLCFRFCRWTCPTRVVQSALIPCLDCQPVFGVSGAGLQADAVSSPFAL